MGLTLHFKFLCIPHSCFIELSVSIHCTLVSPTVWMPLHRWAPQKCLNAAFFRTSENPLFADRFLSLTSHCCCYWYWRRHIRLGCFSACFLYWCEAARVDRVTPVRPGSWNINGIRSFALGICFPGRSLYALQTRKPLSSNWTLLIRSMPSIFADSSQDTSTHSHKTTFTAGTSPHEGTFIFLTSVVANSLYVNRMISLSIDMISLILAGPLDSDMGSVYASKNSWESSLAENPSFAHWISAVVVGQRINSFRFSINAADTSLIMRETVYFGMPTVSPITWRNFPEAKKRCATSIWTVGDKAWFRQVCRSRSSQRSLTKNSMDSRPKRKRLRVLPP